MNAMIVNKRLIQIIKILKDHPASQFSGLYYANYKNLNVMTYAFTTVPLVHTDKNMWPKL